MATIPFRRSQPAALKLLKGNPGKRRIKREPQPRRTELPTPPKHLDDRAKAEWQRVAPELHRLGILTMLDVQTFAAYCAAVSRCADAEQQLKAEGLTVTTVNGNVIQNPLVGIARRAAHDVNKHANDIGLTPVGRTRLLATDETKPDGFDGLLNDGSKDDDAG